MHQQGIDEGWVTCRGDMGHWMKWRASWQGDMGSHCEALGEEGGTVGAAEEGGEAGREQGPARTQMDKSFSTLDHLRLANWQTEILIDWRNIKLTD